jgi:hypothetical protein
MGSPRYGALLVDGTPLPNVGRVEVESLLWSADGGMLAVQELVSWRDGPKTRVAVIDADQHALVAASRPANGLCTPVGFDDEALIYRHWHHTGGTSELRLALPHRGRARE